METVADYVSAIISCPITCDVIEDPVIDPDGNSYERSAILSWLEAGNDNSPITRTRLRKEQLIPNRSLRKFLVLCRQYQQQQQQQLNRDDDDENDGHSEFDNNEEGVDEDDLLDRLLVLSVDGLLEENEEEGEDGVNISNALSCPITGEIMKEPVVDPEGYTFDKAAISAWISLNGTSPLTEARLRRTKRLIPNRSLALLLQRYQQLKENEAILEAENNNNSNNNDATITEENSTHNLTTNQPQQPQQQMEQDESNFLLDSLDDEWTSSVSDFWSSFAEENTAATNKNDNALFPNSLVKLKASYNKRNALVQIKVTDDDNDDDGDGHTGHLPATIVVVLVMDGKEDYANSCASLLDSLKDSILSIIQALNTNDKFAIIVSHPDGHYGSNRRRHTRTRAPQVVVPLTTMTNDGKEMAAEALLLYAPPGQEGGETTNQTGFSRAGNGLLSCALLKAMNMIRSQSDNDDSSSRSRSRNSNILLFTNNTDHTRKSGRATAGGGGRKRARVRNNTSPNNKIYHAASSSSDSSLEIAVNRIRRAANDSRRNIRKNNSKDARMFLRNQRINCANGGANYSNNKDEVVMTLKRYKRKYVDFQCRISALGLVTGDGVNDDEDDGSRNHPPLSSNQGAGSVMTTTLTSIAKLTHGYYHFLPKKKNSHAVILSTVRNLMSNILATAIQETTLEVEFIDNNNSNIELVECVSEMMRKNNDNNSVTMTPLSRTGNDNAGAASSTNSTATLRPTTATTNNNNRKISITIPPLLYGQTLDVLFRINHNNHGCSRTGQQQQSKEITPFCVSLQNKANSRVSNEHDNDDDDSNVMEFGTILAIENAKPIFKNSIESDSMKVANVRFKLIHFLYCAEKSFLSSNSCNNRGSHRATTADTILALQQKVQTMLQVLKKYVHSAQTKNHHDCCEDDNNTASNNGHRGTTSSNATGATTGVLLKAIRNDIEGDISNICSNIMAHHNKSSSSCYWGFYYILSLIHAHILQQPQYNYFVDPSSGDTTGGDDKNFTRSADEGDILSASGGSNGNNSSIQILYPTTKFKRIHMELCGGGNEATSSSGAVDNL